MDLENGLVVSMDEVLSGFQTYAASEKVLAKAWLTKEEQDAWAHLEKMK